jgi:hypothetical protein
MGVSVGRQFAVVLGGLPEDRSRCESDAYACPLHTGC